MRQNIDVQPIAWPRIIVQDRTGDFEELHQQSSKVIPSFNFED